MRSSRQDRGAPREGTSRWLRWGTVAATLAVYALLMAAVAEGAPVGVDGPWLRGLAAGRSDDLTVLVLWVTELGGFWTLTGLTAGTAVLLWRVSARSAIFVALCVAGAGIFNQGAKLLVGRPRPIPEVVEAVYRASGFSFPSGHSMVTMGYFLAMFFVARRLRPRLQWWVLTAGMSLSGAVGMSRMYLGVHYPSDVLAGWTFGAAWVVAMYAWYRDAFGEEPPGAELDRPSDAELVQEEDALEERPPAP